MRGSLARFPERLSRLRRSLSVNLFALVLLASSLPALGLGIAWLASGEDPASQVGATLARARALAPPGASSEQLGAALAALPGFVYVVDGAGRLIAHPRAGLAPGTDLRGLPSVASALAGRAAGHASGTAEVTGADGPMVVGWAAIEGSDRLLIASAPARTAGPAWLPLAALGGALLLGAGLSALVASRVAGPLRAFARQAMEITRGAVGAQVALERTDEVGRLAQIFNYMSQQLLAYDGETRRLYQGIEEGHLQTMLALASVIDSKDSYTLGHSQRVGEWAAEIGRELGLPELEVRHLLYGGILHDVGKIGVVEPILSKRGELTGEEMEAMRAHPVIGASIIGGIAFLRPMLPAVRHHHERWDGTGYPDKLAGEAIPLMARIVGAADVWDACTSDRSYQRAMTAERALEVLYRFRGRSLDPAVVDAIARVVQKKRARGEMVSSADAPASPGGSGST
jgi:HAMP domain-containing protein